MNDTLRKRLQDLYVRKRGTLLAYAVAITRHREAAEDAIHHAFAAVLASQQPPADVEPYLFRAVRNAALDLARSRKSQKHAWDVLPEQPAPQITLSSETNELLQSLSPDERETIVLKVFGAMTFQQIADVRREPLNTVASWYRRGIEKMQSALMKESRT